MWEGESVVDGGLSMHGLVSVIDQVLDALDRGQIEVANRQELREALLVLRSIALEGDAEDGGSTADPAAPTSVTP